MNFNAENSLPSNVLYEERKKYKDNVVLNYFIDMWYEKPFYGKIDRQGYAVSLSEANLKQLQTSKTLFACDFVADAYSDLQDYLASRVLQRRIVLKAPFQPLELEVAWSSSSDLYHSYMQLFYVHFFSLYVTNFSRDKKIKDFDSFLHEFLLFLKASAINLPICKSTFVKSSSCPNNVSGLILEIKAGKHDSDGVKQLLLNNSGFPAFQNSVRKFGFVINKNNPYQLIFNVGSKQGQKYMKKYGILNVPGSASDLFDIYYYQCNEQQDIDLLKSYLTQFYNSYIQARPFTKNKCKIINRQPVAENLVNDNLYWFKIYVIIRMYEAGFGDNIEKIQSVIEKTVSLYKLVDNQTAIKYLEGVLFKES
jgi:hypothetical protein